jgi:hypothetical protein
MRIITVVYKKGLIMLKTPAKLIFGIAALAAATSFGPSTSRAFGDAPWCAVVDRKGEVYWDCQYRTFWRAIRTRWLVAVFAT